MRKIHYILAIILYLCYVLSTIVESNFWGNILAPVVLILASYYSFKGLFLNEKSKILKIGGLLLTLSILNWSISELIWAVVDMIMKKNPDDLIILSISYTISNILIIIAFFFYGLYKLHIWKNLQFVLNVTVISFCTVIVVWVLFLNHNISNLYILQEDIISFASIIVDIAIYAWTNIMFVSVKKGKLPCSQRFIMLGGVLFAVSDILYYYIYIFSEYTPNSLLDAAYVSGFCLIAVAGIIKLEKEEDIMDVNPYHNIDKNINIVTLMIAPVCVLVFQREEIQYVWLLIVIIMFYYVISNYVQKNIYKDVLLNREKEITKQLEDKVYERTQELIKKNKELDRLLNLDIITNLHNRRYLYHKLNAWILQRKNVERILTLYIDVNHHKMIKMMYGNYIGEKILAEAAVKLKNIVEKYQSTTLATYSEDSFVVAMKGLYGYNNGIELANEIIAKLSTLYKVDEYEIQVTLNIGISILPLDSKTAEELIKHADIATSQARMLGFNKIFAFNMQLGEEINRKYRIEMMLKRVNMDEEFQLFYQPQVNTIDSKVIGFEALIRWITKENEFISPAEFIPIAEETGYIIPIGEWVMKKALHTLAKWNRNSVTKYRMGINVSMKQLVGNHFILSLKEEMDSLKIPAEWIDIEITETIQFEENHHIIELLKEFRRMGVSVSIDDFGTGYSSFYYLNRLPINRVKVAKELIDNIVHDNFDYQLVHSLIKVSKIRGIKVIAEGVETVDQLECLKELNCDEIQGYYFSKPMKEVDIQEKYINAEGVH